MDKPMNRIKEVLEERGKTDMAGGKARQKFLHCQLIRLQQTATQFGGTISDSGDSECGCEGFDKR